MSGIKTDAKDFITIPLTCEKIYISIAGDILQPGLFLTGFRGLTHEHLYSDRLWFLANGYTSTTFEFGATQSFYVRRIVTRNKNFVVAYGDTCHCSLSVD